MNEISTDVLKTTHLIFVNPGELQAYWPYLKPRLQTVAERSQARWIPEDVYASLKAGTATCHIGEREEDYLGFMVLAAGNDFDGPVLNVWAVFSEEKSDVIKDFEQDIVQFASKIRAKRIVFTSPRSAWAERLKDYGYTTRMQIFEKEV